MLRMIQQSSAAAQGYYAHLAQSDYAGYYAESQERVGRWGGRAAARLGLAGEVTASQFEALVDNRHPITGERLTVRTKADRTSCYDFNFHAPKSVSIVYELTQDERIVHVFRHAVTETMQELEAGVRTRVRRGGVNAERVTANLAWAEFVHHTSRPVDGRPDPHLHIHAVALNLTWDEQEQRFKAGQFREIKRDASYFEAAFHSRLALGLSDLGYGIERNSHGWELAGVNRQLVEKFSRRTQLIEAEARRRGIKDAELKDQLGAKTRERKTDDHTRSELRQEWESRLTSAERRAIRQTREAERTPAVSAEQALSHAEQHHFERASVVGERQFLRTALRYGVGSVSVEAAHRQLESSNLIRKQREERTFVTSRDVLREESEMLDFARDGRGTCKALVGPERDIQRKFLSGEQQTAIRHVWTSSDRVLAIRGAAGVGKTTLMLECVEGIEASGKKVFTFAPSAQASRGVLRQEGFSKAETVAHLLQDKEAQRAIQDNVIWLDECGLIGTKTMGDVFQLAKERNARVVLSGDSRQHESVERGSAFRLLQDHAGIVPAEVTEIRRQTGDYRRAVQYLSRGEVSAGFERLDQLGFIHELPDDQRYQSLAADYVRAVQAGKSVLVVAPTHIEGEHATSVIRAELQAAGRLNVEEHPIQRLKNQQWTTAERSDTARYESGLVVQFLQNAKGFQRGERVVVQETNQQTVFVEQRGETVALPLHAAKAFQVYRTEPLSLATGDRIQITQNGTSQDGKRLNNGAHYDIAGFTRSGDIRLTNGWVLDREYGHLSFGYTSTSHASQGKTVDRVLVAQSSTSLAASSLEQFYVSCSRGRESVHIYTDDKQALREAVQDSTQRLSATELLQQSPSLPALTWRERAWQQVERVRHYTTQMQATWQQQWEQWRGAWSDRQPKPPQPEYAHER
ncbi:relaxase domain-containing protein [bacterium]|nr:relaxase domain-containing protein [bacterium]